MLVINSCLQSIHTCNKFVFAISHRNRRKKSGKQERRRYNTDTVHRKDYGNRKRRDLQAVTKIYESTTGGRKGQILAAKQRTRKEGERSYAAKGRKLYRISLTGSRTFLHETSHPKNGVRLTIEMRLTFVKLTVRHADAYPVYTKSHMRVSHDLVKGNF